MAGCTLSPAMGALTSGIPCSLLPAPAAPASAPPVQQPSNPELSFSSGCPKVNSGPVAQMVSGSRHLLEGKVREDFEAALNLFQAGRVRHRLLLQLLAPHSVALLVHLGELHPDHVLLQPPHQRQLEEGLREELHLVADLGPDVRVDLEHQELHEVHRLVDAVRLHGDVVEPLRDGALDARAALDLLGDARLGVVQGGQQALRADVVVIQPGRGLLEEDPGVGEGGVQGALEEVHELLELPLHDVVERVEDELSDRLVLLYHLGMLGVQHAVGLLVGRTLEALHELDDRLLLLLEEPLDALADVLHPLLEGQMRVVVQELHHHLAPRDRAHGDAEGLEHVPLLRLRADLGEAEEGLHLEHQAPELRSAVDRHLEGRHFDVGPQVLDVVVQAPEVLRGQREEVVGVADLLVEAVELAQLVVQGHAVDVRADEALHHMVQAVGEGHAAGSDRCQHLRGIRFLQLLRQLLPALVHGGLEVPQLRQHGADRLHKHPLDALLHVLGKVTKANHSEELLGSAQHRKLVQVLIVHLIPEVRKALGWWSALSPVRQCQGKLDKTLGQVSETLKPLVRVVTVKVPVVLVKLVPDQDRPLELWIAF
mmetsp:Transcript_87344/g.255475  ORF Transcript_87344/g.255475 Transcript_87344/m.255475 type:complete len:596 (-) Transcript_87344:665-2452(-)